MRAGHWHQSLTAGQSHLQPGPAISRQPRPAKTVLSPWPAERVSYWSPSRDGSDDAVTASRADKERCRARSAGLAIPRPTRSRLQRLARLPWRAIGRLRTEATTAPAPPATVQARSPAPQRPLAPASRAGPARNISAAPPRVTAAFHASAAARQRLGQDQEGWGRGGGGRWRGTWASAPLLHPLRVLAALRSAPLLHPLRVSAALLLAPLLHPLRVSTALRCAERCPPPPRNASVANSCSVAPLLAGAGSAGVGAPGPVIMGPLGRQTPWARWSLEDLSGRCAGVSERRGVRRSEREG